MPLKPLADRPDLAEQPKTERSYKSLNSLIRELEARRMPEHLVDRINPMLVTLNELPDKVPSFKKEVQNIHRRILGLLEKELKWVPRNHYRNQWMALGMATFGIPMGVAFGAALGNMAFLGIGLPIGMSIGIAVGAGMDKKARVDGRQLQSVTV